jgi:t-SNARE complex subunit (syntaxin)
VTPGQLAIQEFFCQVDTTKDQIETISQACEEIRQLREALVMATNAQEESNISKRLGEIQAAVNPVANVAKHRLGEMSTETKDLKSAETNSDKAMVRQRENVQVQLTRKYVDTMKLYRSRQEQYKNAIKEKMVRQVRVVKPNASQDEIDSVLETGDTAAVYRGAILQGASNKIRQQYADVAEKYEAVKKLEQSMEDLFKMFLDLAVLVEQQGEMLDQIETQVTARPPVAKPTHPHPPNRPPTRVTTTIQLVQFG